MACSVISQLKSPIKRMLSYFPKYESIVKPIISKCDGAKCLCGMYAPPISHFIFLKLISIKIFSIPTEIEGISSDLEGMSSLTLIYKS